MRAVYTHGCVCVGMVPVGRSASWTTAMLGSVWCAAGREEALTASEGRLHARVVGPSFSPLLGAKRFSGELQLVAVLGPSRETRSGLRAELKKNDHKGSIHAHWQRLTSKASQTWP